MGSNKQAKNKFIPSLAKEARHSQNPEGYQHKLIAWHFQCMDDGGTWPCNLKIIEKILPRLREYERMQWNEILRIRGNHPMPFGNITPPAQKRMNEIGYGDTFNLYQLEVKNGHGMQRLWGLRHENVFQILWWDPDHTVYTVKWRK